MYQFLIIACLFTFESDDQQQHTTVQELASLYSNQEETDSKVVLYCKYAHAQGYENVCIRSPVSDVFFFLLHHAKALPCTIYFDTGSGNNKKHLINITKFLADYNQEYCTELTDVYAFTHCDSTTALKELERLSL